MKNQKKVKFNIDENSDSSNNDKKFSKENMVVAVRVRPLNNRELEYSNLETLKITNREMVTVFDPTEYKNAEDQTKGKMREQFYSFDFAFHKNTTQEEVYLYTTQFLLKGVLEGYNATTFAYGASGAGKTYTMVGNGENPGVMIRSLSDLFNLIEEQKDKDFKINISYLEVYNETLRDLLAEGEFTEIDLREDPHKGTTLVGLRELQVTNATEVFKLLV
jgi:kinesin family protein 18/19